MNQETQVDSPYKLGMTVGFAELLEHAWSSRRVLWPIFAACLTGAAALMFLLPNTYRAEALLAPSSSQSMDGLAGVASQYGALLSSVGFSVGDSGVKKTDLGLRVLQSRKFVDEFIHKHDILAQLMAPDRWESETGKLLLDNGQYDMESGAWSSESAKPSRVEAYEEFISALTVDEDKVTGFVTVSFEHRSPIVAKEWLDWLIEDLNSTLMQQDVAQAAQAIEYLREQVETTPLAGLQMVFFNLIEEQTKTVMLAQARDEYLFETIDPAVVPEDTHRPNRIVIFVASVAIAFIISVLYLLLTMRRKVS